MTDIEQLAGRALGPVACTKRQKLVTSSVFFCLDSMPFWAYMTIFIGIVGQI